MTREALNHWYQHKRNRKSLSSVISNKTLSDNWKQNKEAKEKREYKQYLKDNKAHLEAMKQRGEI